MIIFHIFMNLIFLYFTVSSIMKIRNLFKYNDAMQSFQRNIGVISFFIGLMTYLVYIVILIIYYEKDGFDYSSFTLVLLSWDFMFVSTRVLNSKHKNKIDR